MITIPDLVGPDDADLTRAAVRALAAAGGVLPIDDLAEELGYDSYTQEWDAVFDELFDVERLVELNGDRLGDAVTLMSNTTFTRRLTAEELRGGWLCGDADFEPLARVAGQSFPLATGGRLDVAAIPDDAGAPTARLCGPGGWLDGLTTGDLVGLRLSDGLLHVERGAKPDVGSDAPAALAAGASRALALDAEMHDDPRVPLSDVVYEALAGGGTALHGVLPPLTELTATAGLHRIGDFIAEPDAPYPGDRRELGLAMAQLLYELDDADAAAMQDLREARATARTGDPQTAAFERAAAALARPAVAEAFGLETAADEHAVRVAQGVAASATGAARAGALYLLALAAERSGDAGAAERLLNDAMTADASFTPALSDAAWYAEDRGDARRALSLLRRAGEDDADDTSRLLELINPPGGSVGRNQPCSCGSGRKFKTCCGSRAGGPLSERAFWLVDKFVAFALRPAQLDRFEALSVARGLIADGPEWKLEAVTDPLVLDLGAFDGGAWEDFVEQRGGLLPTDERDLARSWLQTRRSVYRLERQRGDILDLHDVVADEPVTARSREAPNLRRGTHLLGRILPCGDALPLLFWAPLMLGEVPIRDHWLELAPQRLAAALPRDGHRLSTTEGEPLMLVTLELSLTDHAAADRLRQELKHAGLEQVDDTTFHEVVDTDGTRRVRGRIMVEGTAVTIDANSEVRAERLRDLLDQIDPAIRLHADRRTTPGQFVEEQDRFGIFPPPYEPIAGARDAVAALLREQELGD